MNREQRRAQARKNSAAKLPFKRLLRRSKFGGMDAFRQSTPYNEEEIARLSNEAKLSWFKLCNGLATTADFDNVVYALNVTRVLSEPLGPEAVGVVTRAQESLVGIRERYMRLGKFGVDADALQHVPPGLDLHDEFLQVCTPRQMTAALHECIKRLERSRDELARAHDASVL